MPGELERAWNGESLDTGKSSGLRRKGLLDGKKDKQPAYSAAASSDSGIWVPKARSKHGTIR